MMELNQCEAPIMEALNRLREARIVPFDVPGHKRGRGNKELTEFWDSSVSQWMSIP